MPFDQPRNWQRQFEHSCAIDQFRNIYAEKLHKWFWLIADAPPLACDQKESKSRQFAKGADPTKIGETTLGQRERSKQCSKRTSQIHEGRIERKNDRSPFGSGYANQACLLRWEKAPTG
jgi:hypothetical protein